jgi:hypothetical protein
MSDLRIRETNEIKVGDLCEVIVTNTYGSQHPSELRCLRLKDRITVDEIKPSNGKLYAFYSTNFNFQGCIPIIWLSKIRSTNKNQVEIRFRS